MPPKHTVRQYIENGVYHVYNRGVEKRIIFESDRDYKTFLRYLKRYLTPPPPNEVRPRWRQELHSEINLLSYCLMPNHFHFLVQQTTKDALAIFMRCLMNSYTRYFNEKYERVGHLFQGRFKAVLVDTDQYILHLSRYIHLNPLTSSTRSDLVDLVNYSYSSYRDYLGLRNTRWVKSDLVLGYFTNQRIDGFLGEVASYRSFVEDYTVAPAELVGDLVIEES